MYGDSVRGCYCNLRNVHDKMTGDKTEFEERFGNDCNVPHIPFGTEIEYTPIIAKDKSRTHQIGKRTLKGLFPSPVSRERLVRRLVDDRIRRFT